MKLKLLIIFIMASVVIYSQNPKSNALEINKLNNKIEILEGQKENLNKQSQLLEKDFEIKKKNLDSRFLENKIEIDKDLSGVRNLLYTLGIGVLGLLLGYWFYFRNFINKKAEEISENKINDIVSNIVEVNKDKILNLIKGQDLELIVKEKSHLLVITESINDKKFLSSFFEEVNIKNVTYVIGNEYIEPTSDIDLVIFDDHRVTKINHNLFNEYIDKSENDKLLFIFFGDRFNAVDRERVNFANSKFTLYNQIMNSLKYNELRK
jgi:hypothetical protein